MKRVLLVLLFVAFGSLVMVREASAKRWLVGDNMGWSTSYGVNYTNWAKGKHFYNGDWLFFVYDRNQMNVLEVKKTDYESCNSDHPLHNWTTGAGRDVVPLNVTRNYYFISGKGFCFGGMKLAVHVEKLPPPQKAAPEVAGAPLALYSRSQVVLLPVVLAVGAAWDAFIHLW
ncbi:hypothetical protein PIB30_056505 [Stylosanthes scabra]|uniref:Phytocyanin domain-containing protein n=1 Tax=Stylosanthes scabra TaxID=79078 RepID=A0ABU6XK38_9FABA|nr:hypothetical protein [Stylosanthes scabra]